MMKSADDLSSAKTIEGGVQFRRLSVPAGIRGATPPSGSQRRDGHRGFDGHSTAARPHYRAVMFRSWPNTLSGRL